VQNQAEVSFSIMTKNVLLIGSYNLELAAYLNPYLRTVFGIRLKLEELPFPNLDAPKFRGSVQTELKVILNSEKIYKHPRVYDPDDDTYTIVVLFNGNLTFPDGFASYDPASGTFKFTPTEESQLGKHKITIELADQHPFQPKKRKVQIDVIVERYDMRAINALKDQLLKNQKKQYLGVRVEKVS